MNEKAFSLLGIARRAGRLALGHDASVESVVKNKARLCLVASDASERLKNEMTHCCSYGGKNIPLLALGCDMKTLSSAIGSKAAVITVNDEGFAARLITLFKEPSVQKPTEQ